MKITEGQVRFLWNELSKNFCSTVVSKPDSTTMKAVGQFLNIVGIMDTETFMKKYATTLLYNIYIPFEIGVPTEEWDLYSQVSVAIHEHHHVHQATENGELQFAASYLGSRAARAHWEAEAFRTGIELYYRVHNTLPDIDRISRHILNYGCGEEEVVYMKQFFTMSLPIIQNGGVLSPVTKLAFKCLGI